jgi:WD40 repeat protein
MGSRAAPLPDSKPRPAASHWVMHRQLRVQGGDAESIRFSPDGNLLAVGDTFRTVRVWDVATGKERAVLSAPTPGNINSLTFSADGKLLAAGNFSGNKAGRVRLWDVATGKQLADLEGPEWSVPTVAFSPNGKLLAAAGSAGFLGAADSGYTVKVWDVSARKLIFQRDNVFTGHGSVLFLPDSKTLVVPRPDGIVKLWDVTSKKERGHFRVAGNSVVALARKGKALVVPSEFHLTGLVLDAGIGPDKKTLASANPDTVKLYNVATGKLRATFDLGWRVYSLAVSANGSMLLATGYEPTAGRAATRPRDAEPVKWWDLTTGRELGRAGAEDLSGSRHLALSPDGKCLATGYGQWDTLWKLEKGAAGKQQKQDP